ncbi:ABC transporter ATP-binding protein [Marinihelvus fidelis]|uniref:ABC transporter ATP-binding protein n=1 Tax=Marinihelvus fidelis TaxID=2613842 RepID=A0A5N0T649_9GAMM|nr:ABC transporter ATP-binding protein [Marinihelvus fidelis]KAA9130540.1 ABC transporter ATP-binding protein [Marinihelvus fidelis]
MTDTALAAVGLRKSFGDTVALDGLDLAVPKGAFFGLLGPNGAGKSTFMSLVTGFQDADGGQFSLFGEVLDPADTGQKLRIGFAPQHIALYKELSAEANLALFGRLYGLSGRGLDQRVEAALELARLMDRRGDRVKTFSGGMMRRLNIAAALLHEPELLLCDEPTVGVDPQSRNAIFETLLELKSRGMTVIYSTHYMEEAERLCDRVAIIDHGRILAEGDIDGLLEGLPAVNAVRVRGGELDEAAVAALSQFGAVSVSERAHHLVPGEGFRLSRFHVWAEGEGLEPRDVIVERPTLEHLFLQLTGRELRE